MNKKKRNPSLKRILLLYTVYTFLFITVFFFLDYYDFYIINPYLLLIISFFLGIIVTFIHVKNKKKSRIDAIVNKL